MQAPNQEQREKLLQYRNKAKLVPQWEDKYIVEEKEIITLVARLLPESPSLTLPESMKQDLRSTSLYGALARWCDSETGLSRYYPQQILNAAAQLITI